MPPDNSSNLEDALVDRDDDINPFEEEYSGTHSGPTMQPYEPELDIEPIPEVVHPKQELSGSTSASNSTNIFARLSPYFQVNSITLQRKIVTALKLKPLSSLRDYELQNNIQLDLYSAVWITATVVMTLFVCTSGAVVFESILRNQLLPMIDFDTMLDDLMLFYGYLVLAPLALYSINRFVIKEKIDFVSTIDCYGISNIVWIPPAFLYVLSGFLGSWLNVYRWVLVAVATTYSGLIITTQINDLTRENSSSRIILYSSIAFHVLFALIVRLLVI